MTNEVAHDFKIGMVSFGLHAYWAQMPGIRDEVTSYGDRVEAILGKHGNIIRLAMVDTVESARAANELFHKHHIDILFVHIGTYFPSNLALHCLHGLHVPIVTLHLQPVDNFNGATHSGYTLPKNTFSAGGELGNVLNRAGVPFGSVVGRLDGDAHAVLEIESWCAAARARRRLRRANLALVGNFYPGMCDLYADLTRITARFGVDVQILEMPAIRQRMEAVNDRAAQACYRDLKSIFELDKGCNPETLDFSCRVAAAMLELAREKWLDALAVHYTGYPGDVEERIGYSMTVGGCLLGSNGIACIAEGDVLLGVNMIALGEIAGGSAQSEINVYDFDKQASFVGHAGPCDPRLAEGRPFMRWLDFFHGKRGSGVSCEFSLKHGPVTLVSLVQHGADYKLVCTEAESVPGERLKNGNVNTRVRFALPIEEFFPLWMAEGPSHHSAMCLGHCADTLQRFAKITGMPFVRI